MIVTGSIIALLIVAGALGGQEQPSDPSSGGQSGQAKQPAEPAQPQAKKSGCSATPGKPNQATESCAPRVGPGKKVTVDGLVYSVLSVKTAKSLGNPTIGTDERAAGTFVIVQLSVHSTKNEAVTLTGDTVKLVARGAAEYSPDSEGSTAALLSAGSGADKPFFLEDVQPDTTTRGTIVYDVAPRVLRRNPKLRFNELGFGNTHTFIRMPL